MTDQALALAVRQAFALFAASYGRKWDIPPEAVNAWTVAFEADQATPDEVRAAANAWAAAKAWPPSRAELRGTIPRLCSCGTCYPCHARSVERAKRAVERGSIGATGFEPTPLADALRTALPPGPKPPPRLAQP